MKRAIAALAFAAILTGPAQAVPPPPPSPPAGQAETVDGYSASGLYGSYVSWVRRRLVLARRLAIATPPQAEGLVSDGAGPRLSVTSLDDDAGFEAAFERWCAPSAAPWRCWWQVRHIQSRPGAALAFANAHFDAAAAAAWLRAQGQTPQVMQSFYPPRAYGLADPTAHAATLLIVRSAEEEACPGVQEAIAAVGPLVESLSAQAAAPEGFVFEMPGPDAVENRITLPAWHFLVPDAWPAGDARGEVTVMGYGQSAASQMIEIIMQPVQTCLAATPAG